MGTGARIPMFIDPIVRDYHADCELAALCDISHVRMNYHRERLAETYGFSGPMAIYGAADFERMLDEIRPDAVIVCTVDSTHHDYIIRSLRKGCEVICEKPLTVDEKKCHEILNTIEETGGKVRVTFNLRWTPGATKVRDLIAQGTIGMVRQVTMEYLLDTDHGADYFRRWHSEKESSGGLLVHKSTHQFDLVNWWLDSIPRTVYAAGNLAFYGKANAIARGDEALTHAERSLGSSREQNPFFFDITAPHLAPLYLEAESETAYIRDRNVFRDGITIEDVMSVIVRYRSGAIFHYSLNAFSPKEGFRVGITGDKGRIEFEELRHSGAAPTSSKLTVMPLFGASYEVDIPYVAGGHGGGDVLLKQQIFSPTPSPDPWGRSAGAEQGAASAIIGIAANRSIQSGLPVTIDDLLCLKPDAHRLSELI